MLLSIGLCFTVLTWLGYPYNPQTRGWGPQYTLDQTGVGLVLLHEIGQNWTEQTQDQDKGNVKKDHFANDDKVEVFNRCVFIKTTMISCQRVTASFQYKI